MEKKSRINRLKSMYPLRAKVDEGYKKSVEAMRAGKPTAWAMVNWWEADPVFKAMDLEVVYPENYGAVVAASGEIAGRYLDISDADGFPTHLCGYSRVNFGYVSRMVNETSGEIPPEAPLGGLPKPVFLLSQALFCDARVKWFQALGHYLDVPVWMLETATPGVEEWSPETRAASLKLIMDEIKNFIGFMEKLLQRRMDWDRYEEVVNDTIELCRLAHETFELRKARPCPMHSRDFYSAMPAYLFMTGDIKDSIKCYQDMYDEVKSRVDNKVGAVEPEKYRLVFGDLPPWHSLGFFDRLAERGWNFVKETWGYNPPLPLEGLTDISDPVERHARFHLQFTTGYYDQAQKDRVYLGYMGYPYLHYARDYKCDGALFHGLITCRSGSTHHPFARDLLLKKIMVPSLQVEGDLVDLRLFDADEALRRAEAFEESMDHYREERKKAGFDW